MNTQMDTMEKLRILSDAAKYDAACTSSGVNRAGVKGQLGSAAACGICHSFASDGPVHLPFKGANDEHMCL